MVRAAADPAELSNQFRVDHDQCHMQKANL